MQQKKTMLEWQRIVDETFDGLFTLIKKRLEVSVCICVFACVSVRHTRLYMHTDRHTCYGGPLAEFCCACSSACQFEASLVRLR